jgi:aromatic-L-amino-acid/L-tryptophan decarboxylase
VMNHTTGPGDVTATLDWFANAPTPSRETPQPISRYEDRRADMESGWGQAGHFDTATLRELPLFASLGDRELEVLHRSARELEVGAGEAVIQRWEGTRNFYVILAGRVGIELEDQQSELGPGQFFGELAALDWGAGFGYVRTATVVARTDVRLLVLAPAILDELVRAAPEVERQIRAAVRERLPSV